MFSLMAGKGLRLCLHRVLKGSQTGPLRHLPFSAYCRGHFHHLLSSHQSPIHRHAPAISISVKRSEIPSNWRIPRKLFPIQMLPCGSGKIQFQLFQDIPGLGPYSFSVLKIPVSGLYLYTPLRVVIHSVLVLSA